MQVLYAWLSVAACHVQILVAKDRRHFGQLRASIEQPLAAGVTQHVRRQRIQ